MKYQHSALDSLLGSTYSTSCKMGGVCVPLIFQVSDMFIAFCIFSLGAAMALSCLVWTSCFPGGFRDVNCRSGILCHRRSCAGPSLVDSSESRLWIDNCGRLILLFFLSVRLLLVPASLLLRFSLLACFSAFSYYSVASLFLRYSAFSAFLFLSSLLRLFSAFPCFSAYLLAALLFLAFLLFLIM